MQDDKQKQPEPEPKPTTARRHSDPIFDNSYNTGTAEIEVNTSLKIDDRYMDDYLGGNIDAHELHRAELLMQDLYRTFSASKYGEAFLKNSKRKIPKSFWAEIFVMLKNSVRDASYNNAEVFTCIADFLGVSYKALYDSVPVVYREQILMELDDSYSIMDNKRKGRLF